MCQTNIPREAADLSEGIKHEPRLFKRCCKALYPFRSQIAFFPLLSDIPLVTLPNVETHLTGFTLDVDRILLMDKALDQPSHHTCGVHSHYAVAVHAFKGKKAPAPHYCQRSLLFDEGIPSVENCAKPHQS